MEEEFYKTIEELYGQIKKIKKTKGYRLEKKFNRLKYDITHFKLTDIFKRVIKNLKLAIYKKDLQVSSRNDKQYYLYKDNKKVVIYTCITGKYDNIFEPIIKEEKCSYFLYTNNQNILSEKFEIIEIPERIREAYKDNILINRYIKMHPHELFENEFDYSIYIDGNIKIISNISSFINNVSMKNGIAMHKHSIRNCIYKEEKALRLLHKGNKKKIRQQLTDYKNKGFPSDYGMLEANVIVTDLNNPKSKDIFNKWWSEFIYSESYRDQLSLPYILWKENIKVDDIATLGNNVYDNCKLEIQDHN